MSVGGGRARSVESLTGAQKCAVLCITLGGKEASRILQQLTPDEVEQVTREITAMQTVSTELAHAVIQDFQSASQASQSVARGGPRVAQQLLEEALGVTQARLVLERVQGKVVDTGLKRLKRAAPEVLAGLMRGEHPQTIALILAHLDMRQAAHVVAAMEPELAADVLYRVARMEKISPEMLALVEVGLSSKADLSLSQEMTLSGGPAAVAKVLNLAGGQLEKELLAGMEKYNADITNQIKALMFVFEDLLLLDGKGMQRLLREVESKELALALKAASDELKQHIKSNMSERAAAALDEEIELLGPVRVRDVQAAHARIIETVRALEQAGELLLRTREGNDDIIS